LSGSSLFVFVINYKHPRCASIIYLHPFWATRAAAWGIRSSAGTNKEPHIDAISERPTAILSPTLPKIY
jgi:hypothetical protein